MKELLTPETLEEIIGYWFSKSIIPPVKDKVIRELNPDLFWTDFRQDYQRYFNTDHVVYSNIITRPELLAILTYRLANSLFKSKNEQSATAISNLGRFLSGIEIYYSASIGAGIKINHGLSTVIGARVVIGKNALIHQGVTLGDKNGARPQIGDNVTIYAGAKILGGVKINDNAIIGANCVCMIDVPENGKIVGVPGKLI
jgi:serine O-acetyltransferase